MTPSEDDLLQPDDDLLRPDDDLPDLDNRLPIIKLWHGDYPLSTAFWGWLLFGQLVWAGIFTLIRAAGGAQVSLARLVLFLAFALGSMTYTAVALVGVWKSAKRYAGPPRWALLAQAVVILILIGFVGDLLKGFLGMP
jgi:hypothetical protein